MRIRRRPPGQSLPSFFAPYSDPSTTQQLENMLRDHQEQRHAGAKKEDGENLQLHHTNKALTDLRNGTLSQTAVALLPQGNTVERLGAQRQEPAPDGHRRSLQNGQQDMPEPTMRTGERVVNGVNKAIIPATEASSVEVTKEETKDFNSSMGGNSDGTRKRRGASVLLEGSRCSRMNGRGWRCSQPTLVGYALCEHHLGKGRMRSTDGATTQLGRTEHIKGASAATANAEPAKVDVPPPSVPHC
ncbi:hypothetical protein ACP4OV_000842 [Aristida adscensionis]